MTRVPAYTKPNQSPPLMRRCASAYCDHTIVYRSSQNVSEWMNTWDFLYIDVCRYTGCVPGALCIFSYQLLACTGHDDLRARQGVAFAKHFISTPQHCVQVDHCRTQAKQHSGKLSGQGWEAWAKSHCLETMNARDLVDLSLTPST
jgi:hypothetical protein